MPAGDDFKGPPGPGFDLLVHMLWCLVLWYSSRVVHVSTLRLIFGLGKLKVMP